MEPNMHTLEIGTVVKINGIPYELLEDVQAKSNNGIVPKDNPAVGESDLAVSQVSQQPA